MKRRGKEAGTLKISQKCETEKVETNLIKEKA